MGALELKVYEIFKNKMGEQEATTIIEYFEHNAEQKYMEKKDILATKDDLNQTKVDIIKWVFAFFITLALMIAGLYLKN